MRRREELHVRVDRHVLAEARDGHAGEDWPGRCAAREAPSSSSVRDERTSGARRCRTPCATARDVRRGTVPLWTRLPWIFGRSRRKHPSCDQFWRCRASHHDAVFRARRWAPRLGARRGDGSDDREALGQWPKGPDRPSRRPALRARLAQRPTARSALRRSRRCRASSPDSYLGRHRTRLEYGVL